MRTCLLTLIAVGLLAAGGCSKSNQASLDVNAGTSASNESGSSKSKGPSVDVDYSYSQKNDYVAKLKSQMADINKQIDNLSDKVANASADARAQASPRLEALKAKARNLDVQIDKVQNASESTWDEVKMNSKKAFSDMKDGFRDARQWLSEKIAP
jgi:predicted  nucleic acid-binding Zn-ribbon protein